MNYQWYPGHMMKAKRMMQEDIKLIDIIIELVDARLPQESRNPDIDQLGINKSRLILLNKADLADPHYNRQWMEFFKNKGYHVIEMNSKTGSGMKLIQDTVQLACKDKIERDKRRGILNRPIRAMVAGIPNVGKSTFINSFAGKACTKTGNKPGVTKGKQWIRLNKNLELLDTPGILWPKFDDQIAGMHLAFIGSINDDIIRTDEMAVDLIQFLLKNYTHVFNQRYGITLDSALEDNVAEPMEILYAIAKNRGCYLKGEELDYRRAANILIDDFRSGKLGRITLEFPIHKGDES